MAVVNPSVLRLSLIHPVATASAKDKPVLTGGCSFFANTLDGENGIYNNLRKPLDLDNNHTIRPKR